MPIVELDDGTGDTIKLLGVDGCYVPSVETFMAGHENEARSIPGWKGREDDVIICAYPKTGTHWVWEVTWMLRHGSAENAAICKEDAMVELTSQTKFDDLPSPRLYDSHLPIDMLPRDVIKLKTKIILVLRNPKDTCVSFYNHHYNILNYCFHGNWKDYVHRYLRGLVDSGSWFEHTLRWERFIEENPDHPVHVVYYEDMKLNTIEEIKRLNAFLDTNADGQLMDEIAAQCDFCTMKKARDAVEETDQWRDGKAAMYRKGEVGDWTNWFTVAQHEEFDAQYRVKMAGSKFKFRFR